MHRIKGRIVLDDGRAKMLQGVREIFELTDVPPGDDGVAAAGKIVVIGRGLRREAWAASLAAGVLGGEED